MSQATKRKYVAQEVVGDFSLPNENQTIVRVVCGRGRDLHEVENSSGDIFIVSMPAKFRKNIWIKKGDYLVIEDIAEGDKVKGEIVRVLLSDQIEYINSHGLWPSSFARALKSKPSESMIPDDMLPPSDDEDNDDDEFYVLNVNRQTGPYYCAATEEVDSEDDSAVGGSDEMDDITDLQASR